MLARTEVSSASEHDSAGFGQSLRSAVAARSGAASELSARGSSSCRAPDARRGRVEVKPVSSVHGKATGTFARLFREHRDELVEGKHYLVAPYAKRSGIPGLASSESSPEESSGLNPNRNVKILLLEHGYLSLASARGRYRHEARRRARPGRRTESASSSRRASAVVSGSRTTAMRSRRSMMTRGGSSFVIPLAAHNPPRSSRFPVASSSSSRAGRRKRRRSAVCWGPLGRKKSPP